MALNSFLFLLAFLPLVVVLAHALRSRRGLSAAQALILAASFAFYLPSGVGGFMLLLASITLNWATGRHLSDAGKPRASRKRLLVLALAVNVGVLCLFKYGNATARLLGLGDAFPPLGFPLGLSFFTLTQVMYLVDCFEGLVPARRWFDHATFVSFFPNITAGPLLRAKLFFNRIENLGSPVALDERITQAAAIVALGLFKKVVLGDSFAQVADAGYASVETLSALEAWVTMFAGTFEIYFDFSGYSDMAFGCAELLGMTLVRNFNVPYRSATISEFWKRWHISLSDFITTYLYTPILRSMGKATVHTSAVATLFAMLVAGIWHGASWNFVLFGLLHGGALAGFQYWKRLKRPLPRPAAVTLTFMFVALSFITVSAADVSTTVAFLARLWPHGGALELSTFAAAIPSSELRIMALPVMFGCVAAFVGPKAEDLARKLRPSVRAEIVIIVLLLAAYVFMSGRVVTEFRYRQF